MAAINLTTIKTDFKRLNASNSNTLNALIGLQYTAIGKDFIQAELPVDQRTHQPYGRLHGGASMVLIESLGSVASYLLVADQGMVAVGIEINANHIRPVRHGYVIGTAKPLHVGRTTHVWQVQIHDQKQRLVCSGRMTTAIIPAAQG